MVGGRMCTRSTKRPAVQKLLPRQDPLQGVHERGGLRGRLCRFKSTHVDRLKEVNGDGNGSRGLICSAGRSSAAPMLYLAQLPSVCVSSREPVLSPGQEERLKCGG